MNIRKINLKNEDERFIYSEKLKEFESQFSYPLGQQIFSLKHGEKYDYFKFFEQLGEISYLVVEENNKIIGAICMVLRTFGQNKKTWYICDFKIDKMHRGKSLYKKIMLKFFLRHYLKNKTMFAINMDKPANNKIYNHSKKIFKYFNVEIESRFLSQFAAADLDNFTPGFWNTHRLVSNCKKKDIIIDGQPIALFHIVKNERQISNIATFNPQFLAKNAQVMYLTKEKLNLFPNEIEISFINKGNSGMYISSAEI